MLNGGKPQAIVDPETFEVSRPAPKPVETTPNPGTDSGETAWIGWAAVGGGLLLIAGLAVALWRRRRPGGGVDEKELERLVRIDAEEREDHEREPVH